MTRAWRDVGQLPATFTPRCVVARPDGTGLVCGKQDGDAAIHRADRDALHQVFEGTGEVVAAAFGPEDTAWAVVGTRKGANVEGSTYALWKAEPPWETWNEAGPLPGESATQVLVAPDGTIWVLGAETLLQSEDGVGWEAVPPPGVQAVNWVTDRLFLAGARVVLGTPEGLYIAGDGGKWGRRHVDGAHVRGLSGAIVAARMGKKTRIGRLEGAFVEWLGDIAGEMDPQAVVAKGRSIQILGIPADPEKHPGLVLLEDRGTDNGFTTTLIRVPPWRDWMGIAGARGALAVSVVRTVMASEAR
ncbi:MAG: hypothetical protein JRI25_14295 [Deltaproteobacteria bacterium]|nr:hypothetical protein [Deltaproteobacteria bacterium]